MKSEDRGLFRFLEADEGSPSLNPEFPDEPLSLAQDLREPPWFSGVFALFLPS